MVHYYDRETQDVLFKHLPFNKFVNERGEVYVCSLATTYPRKNPLAKDFLFAGRKTD